MVGFMSVGKRGRAPAVVDGAGDVTREGEGDGEREGAEKSTPRVKERAGRVPVGEDE